MRGTVVVHERISADAVVWMYIEASATLARVVVAVAFVDTSSRMTSPSRSSSEEQQQQG